MSLLARLRAAAPDAGASPAAAPSDAASGDAAPPPKRGLKSLVFRALKQTQEEAEQEGRPLRKRSSLGSGLLGSRLQSAVKLMRAVDHADRNEKALSDHQAKIADAAKALAAAKKRLKAAEAALALLAGNPKAAAAAVLEQRVQRARLIAEVHQLENEHADLAAQTAVLRSDCVMDEEDLAAFRHFKAVKKLREQRHEDDGAVQRRRREESRQKEATKFSERQKDEAAAAASARAKYKTMQALEKEKEGERAALKQTVAQLRRTVAVQEAGVQGKAVDKSLQAIALRADLIAAKNDLANAHDALKGLNAKYRERAPPLSVAEKRIVKALQKRDQRRAEEMQRKKEEDAARREAGAQAAEAAQRAAAASPRHVLQWKQEFGEQVERHYAMVHASLAAQKALLGAYLAACGAAAEVCAERDARWALQGLASELWDAAVLVDKMAHTLAAHAAEDLRLAQLAPAEAAAAAAAQSKAQLDRIGAGGAPQPAAAAATPARGRWRKLSLASLAASPLRRQGSSSRRSSVSSTASPGADGESDKEAAAGSPPPAARRPFDAGAFFYDLRELEEKAAAPPDAAACPPGSSRLRLEAFDDKLRRQRTLDGTTLTKVFLNTGLRPVKYVAGLKARIVEAKLAKEAQAKGGGGSPVAPGGAGGKKLWYGPAWSALCWYHPAQYRAARFDALAARAARAFAVAPEGAGARGAALCIAAAAVAAVRAAPAEPPPAPARRATIVDAVMYDSSGDSASSPRSARRGSGRRRSSAAADGRRRSSAASSTRVRQQRAAPRTPALSRRSIDRTTDKTVSFSRQTPVGAASVSPTVGFYASWGERAGRGRASPPPPPSSTESPATFAPWARRAPSPQSPSSPPVSK